MNNAELIVGRTTWLAEQEIVFHDQDIDDYVERTGEVSKLNAVVPFANESFSLHAVTLAALVRPLDPGSDSARHVAIGILNVTGETVLTDFDARGTTFWFSISDAGDWKYMAGDATIASGTIAAFDSSQFHLLEVTFDDRQDTAIGTIDQVSVFQVAWSPEVNDFNFVGFELQALEGAVSDFQVRATTDIDLEVSVGNQDADSPTGPLLPLGGETILTYVVRNTGDVDLTNVVVIDDNGTPTDSSDDHTFVREFLSVGDTWTFTRSASVARGQYTSVTRAEVLDPLDRLVSDSDAANYFGADPAIAVEKSINGQATSLPGPELASGSVATFRYHVTNLGNVPLDHVVVVDDNDTPTNSSDDIIPTYHGGDTDADGLLDVDEVWTYTADHLVGVGKNTTQVHASARFTSESFTEQVLAEITSGYVGVPPPDPEPVGPLPEGPVGEPAFIVVPVPDKGPFAKVLPTARYIYIGSYGESESEVFDRWVVEFAPKDDGESFAGGGQPPEQRYRSVLLALAAVIVPDVDGMETSDSPPDLEKPPELPKLADVLPLPIEPQDSADAPGARTWLVATVSGVTMVAAFAAFFAPRWLRRRRGQEASTLTDVFDPDVPAN